MNSFFSRFRREFLYFVVVLFAVFGVIFWMVEGQQSDVSGVVSDGDGGGEGNQNEPPASGGKTENPTSEQTGEIQDDSESPDTSSSGGSGSGGRRSNRSSASQTTETKTDQPTLMVDLQTSVPTSTSDHPITLADDRVLDTESFQSNLGVGASGAEVAKLQRRLQAEGFYTYPRITGYFGVITFNAVLKYQIAHIADIGSSTGFVGPRTRAVLNRVK